MKKLKKFNKKIITKIKPFIKTYNWEGINFLSEKDDRKKNREKQCNNCS